jgi:hypothetical protein
MVMVVMMMMMILVLVLISTLAHFLSRNQHTSALEPRVKGL